MLIYLIKYSQILPWMEHIFCVKTNYEPVRFLPLEFLLGHSPVGWDCRIHPITSVLDMTLKNWWWGSSNAGALGNVEYSFIVIALMSTLARRNSTGSCVISSPSGGVGKYIYIYIYIYIYTSNIYVKQDLVLYNQRWLIYHKPNQTKLASRTTSTRATLIQLLHWRQ